MNMRNISNITSVCFSTSSWKVNHTPNKESWIRTCDLDWHHCLSSTTHGFWSPKRAFSFGVPSWRLPGVPASGGFPMRDFSWLNPYFRRNFVIFVYVVYWVCLKIGNHQFQWTIIILYIFPLWKWLFGVYPTFRHKPLYMWFFLLLKPLLLNAEIHHHMATATSTILGGLALGFLAYPIYDCIYSYITGL